MTTPEPPIRIAYCITELDPGGAERALVQLVTRLNRKEWEPQVFCLSGRGALVETLEEAGVPVVCLQPTGKVNLLTLFRFVKALRKFRPHILHSYLFHANIAGRIAASVARVPVVLSGIRVAEKRSKQPLRIDRWTQWLVDMNVCVSRDVAQFSIKEAKLSPRKIVTIPNGVDAQKFINATTADFSQFDIPPESKTVIVVGRLDPQKNPQIILDVAHRLIEEEPHLHFLFVGDGILKEELMNAVVQQNLNTHVHFAGSREDVPALLKGADCFVLSSLWEGMPNALLEAMATGLPVIATRVEGTAELIEDGLNGLLIEPDSVEELILALQSILKDQTASTAMGKMAQQTVVEGFTWDAVLSSHEEIYHSLITR